MRRAVSESSGVAVPNGKKFNFHPSCPLMHIISGIDQNRHAHPEAAGEGGDAALWQKERNLNLKAVYNSRF